MNKKELVAPFIPKVPLFFKFEIDDKSREKILILSNKIMKERNLIPSSFSKINCCYDVIQFKVIYFFLVFFFEKKIDLFLGYNLENPQFF